MSFNFSFILYNLTHL